LEAHGKGGILVKKISAILMTVIFCALLVAPASASAAVISKEKATMEIDSTLKLKIQGNKETVLWSTSKKSVATVNNSGIVTAKKEGVAKITATVGEEEYVCTVTVVDSNLPTPTPTPIPVTEYPQGLYMVGTDIPEGEYVIIKNPGAENGYMRLATDNALRILIKDSAFNNNTIITVKKGEYLQITDSYAVAIDKATLKTYVDGTFKIGTHLPAGSYQLDTLANKKGYYYILDDNRYIPYYGRVEIDSTSWVWVKEGQYLVLDNCIIKEQQK
jgi:hypothetical protein